MRCIRTNTVLCIVDTQHSTQHTIPWHAYMPSWMAQAHDTVIYLHAVLCLLYFTDSRSLWLSVDRTWYLGG